MPRKSLRIRRGCGLLALANDNPASTRKSRRIVIVGVFILGICAIPTAHIGIGGREYASRHVRKMVCVGIQRRFAFEV